MTVVFDIPTDLEESWKYFNVVVEPSNRATVLTHRQTINEIEIVDYRSGKTSLVLINEDYKMIYSAIMFKAFNPFIETCMEILGWMEAFGFMELWRREWIYLPSINSEDVGPQVLTMDHLRVGFLACCIPLILSVAAFIAELVWSRLDLIIIWIRQCMRRILFLIVPSIFF